MLRFILFLGFSSLLISNTSAQSLTYGPLVGGVTSNSARIYIRTDLPTNIQLEVDTDSSFSNPQIFNTVSNANDYHVSIIELTNLQTFALHYYQIKLNGNAVANGQFKTFPLDDQSGYYKVVVGSCNYHDQFGGGGHTGLDYTNDVLFQSIVNFDPNIVLHLGDWSYPPSAFGWQYNLDDSLAAESFSARYSDYNMSTYLMPRFPIDYVYDDDYSQNGVSGITYPSVSTGTDWLGNTYYILDDNPMPPAIRTGAIESYFENFPSYSQVDSSGVHHSFKLGNIEFFMLDTRNPKSPNHGAFVFQPLTSTYTFQPPAGHSTLGQIQRDWLINGLKNSTADWKVIGSSVVFNKRFRDLLQLLIPVQLIDRSVVNLMSSLAYMWAGYPEDMDAILDTIASNNIQNVIVLSGDTHSSMMDDGTNSGLPELSSSGWAAGDEGYLNYTIDSVAQSFSLGFTSIKSFLWNGGGSGIDNSNFSDTYGTLEFFYQDSVKMCIVDEFDQTLACQTILFDGATSTNVTQSVRPDEVFILYPNPTKDLLRFKIEDTNLAQELDIEIYANNGAKVLEKTLDATKDDLNIQQLPKGIYTVVIKTPNRIIQRSFAKH